MKSRKDEKTLKVGCLGNDYDMLHLKLFHFLKSILGYVEGQEYPELRPVVIKDKISRLLRWRL